MGYKATNNAYALLGSSISAVATTLTVQSGFGDKFPVIASPDFTYVTLENASGAREIVKVTARTLGQDVMTIERAQEGTLAAAWSAGDVVECRPTAGIVQRAIEHIDDTVDAHNASAIAFTPAGSISASNLQDAVVELSTEKASVTDLNNAVAGLGSMSTQNANAVNITGGNVSANGSLNGVSVGSNGGGTKTISTAAPSGGSDGDVWYRY